MSVIPWNFGIRGLHLGDIAVSGVRRKNCARNFHSIRNRLKSLTSFEIKSTNVLSCLFFSAIKTVLLSGAQERL
jgi:hypothetical protein